jgi:hypothetical protein
MEETFLKNQGYRYYVYLGPGQIEYFRCYEDARLYADNNGAEVKEMF